MDHDIVKEILQGCRIKEGTPGENRLFLVVVTPPVARRWLLRNTNNRPVNALNLTKMVHNLKKDEFGETSNSIGFTDEGVLSDGQTRLMAIAASEVTQVLSVKFGIKPEHVQYQDTGLVERSLAQSMIMSGRFKQPYTVQVAMAGIGKSMLNPDTRKLRKFTPSELMDHIDEHQEDIIFAHMLMAGTGPDGKVIYKPAKRRKIDTAPVKACLALARLRGVCDDDLKAFTDVLVRGEVRYKKDRTITQLRDFLLRGETSDSKKFPVEVRQEFDQALKAWLQGREVGHTRRGKPFLPVIKIKGALA